ncbi:hypothetical protein SLS53_002493 [Cytospora paraplurivora]|uniref:Zn(2)-C6 fungal-type domain-containing protein n=1 Tax=Cytospora paraplurivora TaxID=2898453 RepID=A0AAN9YIV9_9PEZI
MEQQCRFRKVRCDGKHGEKGCGDCERLKFACSFVTQPTPPTPTVSTAADDGSADQPSPVSDRPVERRRTSKACAACRHQKVRCSGGTPCLACKKKGVTCVYGNDGRRRGSRVAVSVSSASWTPTETTFTGVAESTSGGDDASNTSPTPTTPGTTTYEPPPISNNFTGSALLPPDIQVLIDFYFAHVYPLPSYAFLNPQTTIRQCSEGQLDPCLSYAISAVASYHRGSPHRKEQIELTWIQAAEDLIWKHLESPTVPRLQALLLVIRYRVETGALQRAFMLSGLAARDAAAIRLNHERTAAVQGHGYKVGQEVRRRLMWSLKMVERYFSIGLPEFELCPVECIYLELPCWERDFGDSPPPESTKATLQACDFGSYHFCVRLEMLRRDIMKLTRSLALCDTASPQLPTVMGNFEQHLTRISSEFPNGPTLTAERISQLLDSPWLPRHILVHLSFHQCQCDLYRLLLRGYREAAPAVVLDAMGPDLLVKAEQLCLQHATAIVDILATLNQLSHQACPLEFDTAICGYHATRLLLFIAQSSHLATKPGEEWALSRAELCLAALRRFFPTSKLVKPVLEEMRRAITVFSTRGAANAPARLTSPGPTANGGKDPDAGLSAAARVRQRLAIHSLLRQADFPDEEEGPEVTNGNNMAPVPPPASSPRAPAPGIASLENPRRPSSTFVSSPRTSPEGESWQFGWLNNGDFADRWDPEPQSGRGAGGGPPSFSFPWLQRGEGVPAGGGESSR